MGLLLLFKSNLKVSIVLISADNVEYYSLKNHYFMINRIISGVHGPQISFPYFPCVHIYAGVCAPTLDKAHTHVF